MTTHLIAFFGTLIWHIVYIYAVKAIARNRATLATGINMFAWILYGKITISYVENNWLLISSMLGAGVGTYISMKFFKDVKSNVEENRPFGLDDKLG